MAVWGLATDTEIKARLEPGGDSERPDDWDTKLASAGAGVLATFETFTNRRLVRVESDTFSTSAARTFVQLPRFPVEDVTAFTRLEEFGGTPEDILDSICGLRKESGLLYFDHVTHERDETLTATYTGGYWVDDGVASLPAGATQLPGDLQEAFFMALDAVATATGLLGSAALRKVGASKNRGGVDYQPPQFPELVEEVLRNYRRF